MGFRYCSKWHYEDFVVTGQQDSVKSKSFLLTQVGFFLCFMRPVNLFWRQFLAQLITKLRNIITDNEIQRFFLWSEFTFRRLFIGLLNNIVSRTQLTAPKIYSQNNYLTSRSWVIFEKLLVLQLVKKFPMFYENRIYPFHKSPPLVPTLSWINPVLAFPYFVLGWL